MKKLFWAHPIDKIHIPTDIFNQSFGFAFITFEDITPDQAILSVGFRPGLRRISSESDKTWQGFDRVVCSSGRIRLKGFRQLTAEIRPRLFGSDGIRLGIIDLGQLSIRYLIISKVKVNFILFGK